MTASSENNSGGRLKMQPTTVALVLVSFAVVQVVAYTAFRLADFRGFALSSIKPLLSDGYFWLGVLSSMGVFVLSFTLVRVSETSFVLVLLLYMSSILALFILLPLTWKFVFNESIFTTRDRIYAFGIAMTCAGGLLMAKFLWDRGG